MAYANSYYVVLIKGMYMNYKITVQYDGTAYRGWQVQKNTDNTIQGKLQAILSRLTGSEINVIGSGRTDAGVHASCQVANFHIDLVNGISEGKLLDYINSHLPEDIAVISLEKVDKSFHARYNAISKTYRYRIHLSPISDVFNKKYVYTYTDMPLDIDKMQEAARLLTGTHDFRSFCSNRHMKKSTVRTITDISINEVYANGRLSEIYIDYTGDGFLQNMVRILTGTLIEVGTNRIEVKDIPKIIEAGNREIAGYTAPAQGLCLINVSY